MRRAQELHSVTAACRQLGMSRTLFCRWRQRYLRYGADGLRPRPPRRARAPVLLYDAGRASVASTAFVRPAVSNSSTSIRTAST